MDAYIYKGARYCADCGKRIASSLTANGIADTGDSNDFPQGPYADGGGESDSLEVCDFCHTPLDNPLTGYGISDELSRLADFIRFPAYRDNMNIERLLYVAEQLRWYGLSESQQAVLDKFSAEAASLA